MVWWGCQTKGPVSSGLDCAAAWCAQRGSPLPWMGKMLVYSLAEEEATDTLVETNPVIHFHSLQELACELRIGNF